MKLVCKVCEKAFRGNASREEYDEVTQEMSYVCIPCDKLMTSGIDKVKVHTDGTLYI